MSVKAIEGGGVMVTGKHIELVRLLSIKGRLSLELKGLKFRGGSTFGYVKREYGLRGSRQSVYDQFLKLVEDTKAALQNAEVSNG